MAQSLQCLRALGGDATDHREALESAAVATRVIEQAVRAGASGTPQLLIQRFYWSPRSGGRNRWLCGRDSPSSAELRGGAHVGSARDIAVFSVPVPDSLSLAAQSSVWMHLTNKIFRLFSLNHTLVEISAFSIDSDVLHPWWFLLFIKLVKVIVTSNQSCFTGK